jgi:hypothetical protein
MEIADISVLTNDIIKGLNEEILEELAIDYDDFLANNTYEYLENRNYIVINFTDKTVLYHGYFNDNEKYCFVKNNVIVDDNVDNYKAYFGYTNDLNAFIEHLIELGEVDISDGHKCKCESSEQIFTVLRQYTYLYDDEEYNSKWGIYWKKLRYCQNHLCIKDMPPMSNVKKEIVFKNGNMVNI